MKEVIKRAYENGVTHSKKGKVADYIPELSKEDPNSAGVVFIKEDGEVISFGEVEKTFSIQSVSKVVTYLLVLENIPSEKIDRAFGVKPTALPFNSLLDLELGNGLPRNPLVNAGAMSATALLYEKFGEKTFDVILEKIRLLCENPSITYSEAIYKSERDSAFNNRGMMNIMAARGSVSDKLPLDEVANTYFKTCSILVNAMDLGKLSYVISKDGIDTKGERIFDEQFGKMLRTVMAMGGMYDYSGEFAMKVGLPGKSGVGGGIIVASNKGFGLATYCPGLDEFGNSLVGVKILESISKDLNLSIY